jgi:hypothetical protein
MTVFSDEEHALLDKIAIDMELDKLSPANRALMKLRFAYQIPDDYAGPWPPDYRLTGAYVGRRYFGKPISATRIQHQTARLLAQWKRRHD